MSKVVRSVKNVTKGYSTPEIKVRNATSNDPWGPVGSDMAEIAQMTFTDTHTFQQIMDMLDKRLNDKGKNWRHVLKSLKVLDYCLHEGSELVITWARRNIYIIRTLREFQYVDDEGKDVGNNIRVSAKELTALIMDDERLRVERADRKFWKWRVTGIEDFAISSMPNEDFENRKNESRVRQADNEDVEYQLALEASRNQAEEDAKRRARQEGELSADDDLAKAIRLSKEEEEARNKKSKAAVEDLLIDESPAENSTAPTQLPQQTGWNYGYQQQAAVDWVGNPISQHQQPQLTGYLGIQPTGYNDMFMSQTFGNMNAPTGYLGGTAMYPQPTGFLQPQHTAFNANNPYGQMNNGMNQFDQITNQSTINPSQERPQPGRNNPWAVPNTMNTEPLGPQTTGSNNPFASHNRQQNQPAIGKLIDAEPPPIGNKVFSSYFNNDSAPRTTKSPFSFGAVQSSSSTISPPKPIDTESDMHKTRLNDLLSTGEGLDTFGNVGELRVPAQHTAPGTFVNSAGSGLRQ